MARFAHSFVFASLALGVAGCTATVQPAPVVVTDGTLVMDWTINNTTDPNQCAMGGVDTFRVQIFDAGGGFVGEYTQTCEAFATTISLPEGSYSGTARLVDAGGRDRTTTINVVPWNIVAGTQLNVSVDFPASSFLGVGPQSEAPAAP